MRETFVYLLVAAMYSVILLSFSVLAGCESAKYVECVMRDNTRNPCN
jgi:hypothetical protein